jgi:hypothetical protein
MLRTNRLLPAVTRPNLRRRSAVALAALVAVFGAAPAAKAEVLATATRADPPVIRGPGPLNPIPLFDDGAETLTFRTTAPGQRVVITFNAECRVREGGYVTVVIEVDGIQAHPRSGNNFAFCATAPGNAFLPVGAVRQSFLLIQNAGVHTVVVRANSVNGPAVWQLDDISLVVEQ